MTHKYSLVVFDLDGTLVDSKYDLADSLNYAAQKMGYAFTPDSAIPKMVGDGVKMLINRCFDLEYGSNKSAEALALFMDYYERNLTTRSEVYAGVAQLLANMPKGISMAVLSNKPHELTLKVIEQLGFSEHFELVMGSSSSFARKPSGEPLLHIMQELSVEPAYTLMVGDGDADLGTARNAACNVCGVTYGYRSREDLQKLSPDYLIDSIGELMAILQ